MNHESSAAQKSQLREKIRRATHHDADSSAICSAVADWIRQHPQLQTIASYSALRGEVDLSTLPPQFPEKRWLYPKVDGETLSLHEIRDPSTELIPGVYGILEPHSDTTIVAAHEVDAFLCPGMAFDHCGGRLGRGKGYYDRLLAHARTDAHKIGIAFPSQIVPTTHCEPHDILMDKIIS